MVEGRRFEKVEQNYSRQSQAKSTQGRVAGAYKEKKRDDLATRESRRRTMEGGGGVKVILCLLPWVNIL